MNILDRADAVGTLRGVLARRGLTLEVIDDYSKITDILEFAGKDYLTPFSSPDHNDFNTTNCIWLCASDSDGPVMVGAARLEDIGSETLDRYWGRTFKRAYPMDGIRRIENVSSSITSKVGGRLVYFGDLFVAGRVRGSRQSLRVFTAIGHLLCSLKWEPDWIYCFLRRSDAARGAAYLYGFSLVEQKPYNWVGDPPAGRSNRECAAFLECNGLAGVVGALLDDLIASNG